ncbi:MAG: hypothetical protein AAB881_00070 [Patescibacteria group bacterium]
MKKVLIAVVSIVIVVLVVFMVREEKNTWVQNDNGVWVKQGNPEKTPEEVTTQQNLIDDAKNLFKEEKESGADVSSGPCIGKLNDDWVVDIVHNPREAIDNRPENQCLDYINGDVKHFIELDLDGEVQNIH